MPLPCQHGGSLRDVQKRSAMCSVSYEYKTTRPPRCDVDSESIGISFPIAVTHLCGFLSLSLPTFA